MNAARALGLLIGQAADRLLGDPARHHPVAWFGSVASTVERRTYRDDRAAGLLHVVTLVGTVAMGGAVVRRVLPGFVGEVASTAAATWVVVGGRSLEREAATVRRFLVAGDLPAARQQLTHLVGRDTTQLSESDIARATIESVAENTSDAVVAPLVWGAVAGVPGLVGYRAANTLDAMIGHRTVRYERFGWAAARLDDLLNVVPARMAAVWAALLSPRPGDAISAWRHDAAGHPSPNAGPVEASFAGALGLQLGGVNRYGDRVEDRSTLGHGRAPTRDDVDQAVALAQRVGAASAVSAAVLAVTRGRRPSRRPAQDR